MWVHTAFVSVGEGGGGERETPGYEPFALHAPIQWAISGGVTAKEGLFENVRHLPRQARKQIVFFYCLCLYHKSPDSGERHCKSRACKRPFAGG